MDNIEMKNKLDFLESQFLLNLAFPDGGKINRAGLRNIDCQTVGSSSAVFQNKDNKFIIIPFNYRGRFYPSSFEISQKFISDIVEWLIEKDPSTNAAQKEELATFVPIWFDMRPSSPENAEKINKYDLLKKELQAKGLI